MSIFNRFDESLMAFILKMEDDDGVEDEVRVPAKYEVCSDCNGSGFTLCEGMRGHAYSQEEFQEEFDAEEREEYFKRGGMYDVICSTCSGKRVEPVVNDEWLKKHPEIQKEIELRARYEREDRLEREMERRMGA